MSIYIDTGVLIKLYAPESNSSDAVRLAAKHSGPKWLTPWQQIEARTAIRAKTFRKEMTTAESVRALARLEADVTSDVWWLSTPDPIKVFALAEELSDLHTAALGCRTLDILHVAAARTLRVEWFLTFDVRQAALAKRAGLKVESS